MYSLGRLYYLGLGVPKDYIESYKWFLIGAMLKHEKSRLTMDVVAAEMTNADVTQSVTRAGVFVDAFEIRRVAAEEEKEHAATAAASSPPTVAATSGAGSSLREKLLELKELEEAGLISKELADEKRKALLEDL